MAPPSFLSQVHLDIFPLDTRKEIQFEETSRPIDIFSATMPLIRDRENQQPFVCAVCGLECLDESVMDSHVERIHNRRQAGGVGGGRGSESGSSPRGRANLRPRRSPGQGWPQEPTEGIGAGGGSEFSRRPGRENTCPECGKRFIFRAVMFKHIDEMHPQDRPRQGRPQGHPGGSRGGSGGKPGSARQDLPSQGEVIRCGHCGERFPDMAAKLTHAQQRRPRV